MRAVDDAVIDVRGSLLWVVLIIIEGRGTVRIPQRTNHYHITAKCSLLTLAEPGPVRGKSSAGTSVVYILIKVNGSPNSKSCPVRGGDSSRPESDDEAGKICLSGLLQFLHNNAADFKGVVI